MQQLLAPLCGHRVQKIRFVDVFTFLFVDLLLLLSLLLLFIFSGSATKRGL
jgi:hypothetical protein